MGREYVLKRRAEHMDETRRRITEAIVHLHETVGPAQTTVSAIAAQAGVERLTVYRHFPDEAALLEACTSHWRARNPAPEVAAWEALADPETRLREALAELYPYYRRNRRMLSNSFRDRALVPALAAQMTGLDAYLRAALDTLARPWQVARPARRLLVAAVGHAVDFRTWTSLDAQGLDDAAAGVLMVALVRAVARGPVTVRPGRTTPISAARRRGGRRTRSAA